MTTTTENTIRVELGERSYDVRIEADSLANYAAQEWDEIALLSNESVLPLYGRDFVQRRDQLGLKTIEIVAPDGESAKNLTMMARAYDELAQARLTRRGAIVALGGGVVGDWAGFVAATWMRGVDWVQIPTTLLAMVDSSVGGKTGINHQSAKNLIGAFHQPKCVIIDPQVLATLPARELHAGLAEVIKYGVIADSEFFAWLEAHENLLDDSAALEHLIARSVQIKADVVGEDERESDSSGRRAILNYGHTLGHAIEATATYGKYLHGEAIAIGMTVAAQLAIDLQIVQAGEELSQRQTRLFEKYALPTRVPDECAWDDLLRAMALDKKSRGASLNFVLPTRLGEVEIVRDVPREAVENAVQKCR